MSKSEVAHLVVNGQEVQAIVNQCQVNFMTEPESYETGTLVAQARSIFVCPHLFLLSFWFFFLSFT
jgi:hypothetical protein